MSNSFLFGSASHLASRGSWKAGSPTSNPLLLKAESRQFFIPPVAFVTWKHGADVERYHNKSPWRPQTKKSNRNLTVKGISCLDLARAANFGNRIFTAKKQFESITNSQLIHRSWQCSSWIVTPPSINHPYQLSELLMSSMSLQRMVGMDSWNKTCRTRFFSAEAINSISTILHWLSAVASTRQGRSQWISGNPKLGYHNSIFCKHDATIIQSWRSVLLLKAQPSRRECRIRFHKRPGFLRQHVAWTSFRPCVTFGKQGQLFGRQPRF